MPGSTISAVIITFNEEKNIGRCLDSLRGVADEVIVIDSFSTDGTEMICLAAGAKFIRFPWGGYSTSKNFGNAHATGNFILSIDADECLSDELRENLLKEKENPGTLAISFNRLTNYCGRWIRHGGWYPDAKIRLFTAGAALWAGEVHEELVFNAPPQKKHLSGDLLHYSYPTVSSHLLKSLQYAELIARRDFKNGKRKNLIYHGIIKPCFFFCKQYFIKLGFLDGYYGFIIAVISALEKFMRFVSYRELKRNSE